MNIIIKKEDLFVRDKRKFFITIFIILILLLIFIFFRKNVANIFKNGNTNISQENVNDILNLKSYELISKITIKSNKNENKYVIKQSYINPDYSSQEVLEPENIKGTKIIREKNQIKLENTSLNLTTIFQDYEYVSENMLDLSTFLEEYKEGKTNIKENEKEKILEVILSDNNPYVGKKILYIDKDTGKPTKMEIEDDNKNTKSHILYTEVKINNLS